MKILSVQNKAYFRSSRAKSVYLHAGVIALAILYSLKPAAKLNLRDAIELEVISKSGTAGADSVAAKPAVHHSAKIAARSVSRPIPSLDLRPSYMKDGSLFVKHDEPAAPSGGLTFRDNAIAGKDTRGTGDSSGTSAEVLKTPLVVNTAFDHLAAQINRNLVYPALLVENSIEGSAVLELRFDRGGNVSESESNFSGNNRFIRGLMVQAARAGLLEWYHSDTYRLHKEDFKGQHFRAEISISYVEADLSELSKTGSGFYQMTRRRYKDNTCGAPFGVDLICLAAKTKGAVENMMNDNARIRLDLLKDKLDHWDELGLAGINRLIHES